MLKPRRLIDKSDVRKERTESHFLKIWSYWKDKVTINYLEKLKEGNEKIYICGI